MKYKAILFDLDGTLLPMDTDTFTSGYFKLLAVKLAPYGIEAGTLTKAIWAGTAAMVKNDGTKTNEDVFWHTFTKLTGVEKATVNDVCLEFYAKEFRGARCFTGQNPLAAQAVQLARRKADKVALATNPLFPMCGQITRMSWLDLTPADFDLVTSYETDRFCKPNPAYFTSVCQRLDVLPEECLMIGNDEGEDMAAATAAGLHAWLVTDWCIRSEKHPWHGPQGTFEELIQMLESLEIGEGF